MKTADTAAIHHFKYFFFFIYRFEGFGDAVSKLTSILMPFIYGAVIAYLLKPVCTHSAELEGQYLAGNLLADLSMKDSRVFRKEIEKIAREVFGC